MSSTIVSLHDTIQTKKGLTHLTSFHCVRAVEACFFCHDVDRLSSCSGSVRRKFCLLLSPFLSEILGTNGIRGVHCSGLLDGTGGPQHCRSLDVAGCQQWKRKLYILHVPCVQCISRSDFGAIHKCQYATRQGITTYEGKGNTMIATS